jgi:hypothetical protein
MSSLSFNRLIIGDTRHQVAASLRMLLAGPVANLKQDPQHDKKLVQYLLLARHEFKQDDS